MHILFKLLGMAMLFTMFVMGMGASNITKMFIDMPSLYMVGGVVLSGIFLTHGFRPILFALEHFFSRKPCTNQDEFKHCVNALDFYSQLSFAGGVSGTIIGAIGMLYNLDNPENIGPTMAVAILTVLYAVLLSEFFFQILKNSLINKNTLMAETLENKREIYKNTSRWKWLAYTVVTILTLYMTIIAALSLFTTDKKNIDDSYSEMVARPMLYGTHTLKHTFLTFLSTNS